MSAKIPVRTVFDSSNNAIGLSEFQSGEFVNFTHGGTGLTSLGSSGQILQVNSLGNALEYGNKADTTTFVSKTDAVTSNNALLSLINDRMQIANVSSLVSSEINNLLDGAPDALNTLNELAAALGDDANFISTITTNVNSRLAANANLTLSGDVSASGNFSSNALSLTVDISSTGTSTGTFGSSSQVPVVTVAADGRITSISNTAVAGVDSVSYNTANSLLTINTSDGGSQTTNITLQPFDTDNLSEGSTNQYFTTARARASFSAGSGINISSGVISTSTPYVTKTDAVNSNNAVKILIEDRMQVANVTSIQTSLQSNIDDCMQVANVTSIQTTLQNSINDRLQVANAASIYAPLASPTLTGTPAAPTAAEGTNTTQIATTQFVRTEVSNLANSAPAALDTLNELAAALNDDANFSATVTNSIATKLAVSNANITIAADVGSDDVVSIVSDTLTFEGTANEIVTTVSNNNINISQPVNVTIGNNLTVSANVVASGTVSAADFNSTSDQRLKSNIQDSSESGNIVDKIKVRQFDWIESGEHQQFGFVAQELVDVYPDAVVSGSNPDDIWRINYNLVVPLLVKEIQQLKARIKNLEDS